MANSHDPEGFSSLQGEFGRLLAGRRSGRKYARGALPLASVQRVLLAGAGISGSDGKRTVPSAHALYPLRLYLIARRIGSLEPGFYAFDNEAPALRRAGGAPAEGALLAVSLASDDWLEEAAAVIVIGADRQAAMAHFADQQSDGLRGLRYVDFEAGACAQNMALCVAHEDLAGVVVMGFDDGRLKALLEIPRHIDPVALFCVGAKPLDP